MHNRLEVSAGARTAGSTGLRGSSLGRQPVDERPAAGATSRVEVGGWPLLGALPALLRDPAGFCLRMTLEYPGRVVRVRVGPGSVLLVTDPRHVEHVLVHNTDNYWKGDIFQALRPIFGEGLLLSEGARWKRDRTLLLPSFSMQRIRRMLPELQMSVRQVTSQWQPGSALDVDREMRRITLRIILQLIFSDTLERDSMRRIEAAFERVLRIAPWALFTWSVPGAGQRLLRRCVRELDGEIDRLIEERRASSSRREDVLSLLLQARDAQGAPLAARALRDHVVTTIFGGYEATATALYWLWILLDRDPGVRERAQREIDAASGLEGLSYARQVIDETLRLFPPFWGSFRTAYADDAIGGESIRAGESLLLSPYALQRDPRHWDRPDVFDPDRFAAGGGPAHRCSYIPFLTGPRICVGRGFALFEMLVVFSMIARDWELRLTDPAWPLRASAAGSLRPRGKPPMFAVRRS
jgi:enediyne biosynthesis protein E7